MLDSVANVMEWNLGWPPRAHPTHPEADSITIAAADKARFAKAPKGSAATEQDSSSSSLCFYIIGNHYGDVMIWRIKSSIPCFFFHFPFFSYNLRSQSDG